MSITRDKNLSVDINQVDTNQVNLVKDIKKPFSITLKEKIDIGKLRWIIHNFDSLTTEWSKKPNELQSQKTRLQTYLCCYKNHLTVTYKRTPGSKSGRLFCKPVGLQSLKKVFRHTIAGDLYYDIDMVNAHPTLLSQWCKKNNMPSPLLNDYIDNREERLQELVNLHSITRSYAKQIVLEHLNGKFENLSESTQFLRDFSNEIIGIHEVVKAFRPDLWARTVKKKGENGYNLLGSCCNHLMCELEDNALRCMLRYFEDKDVANYVSLVFDGIMILKDNVTDIDALLKGAEQSIRSGVHYDIKLECKPMNDGFKDAVSISHFPDAFNPTDLSLTYSHFYIELTNRIWDNEIQLRQYFIETFPQVMNVVVTGTNNFYIKRIDNAYDQSTGVLSGSARVQTAKGVVQVKLLALFDDLCQHFSRKHKADCLPYNTVKYSSDPNCNELVLNTYIRPKSKFLPDVTDFTSIQPIIDHIRNIWCSGDDIKYQYVRSWMANLVQFPEKPNGTMIVLQSEQGAGKGIVGEFLVKLLGTHCAGKTEDLEKVTGRFNGFLERKALIILDDTSSADSYKTGCWNKLKSLITDEVQTIEKKGLETCTIKNTCSFMMFTNQTAGVKIEASDRRMCVLRCSSDRIGDYDYFDRLGDCLENSDCADLFYTWLHNQTDLVRLTKIPNTEEKSEMKFLTLELVLKFLYHIKTGEYDLEIEGDCVKASDLFIEFTNWCTKNNEDCKKYSTTKFGGILGRYVDKRRCKSGVVYNISDLSKLPEL